MCGIIGYIGNKPAVPILLQGLTELEYRGYDSAGIAFFENNTVQRIREVGKVDALLKKVNQHVIIATAGIGHTRWATHGAVTEKNTHPHVSGKISLVHNGIIENYRDLQKKLQNPFMESETDSEVIAKLIEQLYTGNLADAVQCALLEVHGTYGLLVLHEDHPDELIAARLGSPLAVGISENGFYIASDTAPLLPHTQRIIFLDDGEIAQIHRTAGLKVRTLHNEMVHKKVSLISNAGHIPSKGLHKDFMLKEIFEQPTVFQDALRGRISTKNTTVQLAGLHMSNEQLAAIKKIVIVAEGTAWHAGLVAKHAFETLARIPTEVDLSSEFRYRSPILNESTLVLALSQSGETADTLMALREAKKHGAMVRSIVNTVGSTIAREAGAGSYIYAGPELAVASTKAYTNMVGVLLLYALKFSERSGIVGFLDQREDIIAGLLAVTHQMQEILLHNMEIKNLAGAYKDYANILFMGRGVNHPVALEGALKMKEISYIHCQGFAGGEMKHGSLALVSSEVLVVAIVTKNHIYEKMKNSIMEARTRGARVLAIATEGDVEIKEMVDDVFYVPKSPMLLEPLLTTIPLQLLAYHMAIALGRDADRPRNLAKSVTVE